jgi:hypothetical protein
MSCCLFRRGGEPERRRSGSYVTWRLIEGGSLSASRLDGLLLTGHASALARTTVRRDASSGLNLGRGQRDEAIDRFPSPVAPFFQVGRVLRVMDRPRQLEGPVRGDDERRVVGHELDLGKRS